jgi:hypothetical protein
MKQILTNTAQMIRGGFPNCLDHTKVTICTLALVVLNLFAMMKAQAQFINPVTPDIPAGCTSIGVTNTGTSAFADLQVLVVDGANPSIVFVDYSTSPPTEFCYPILASSMGAVVNDPDVVWDYSGSGLLLVVYESDLMGSNGIWSEMWDWNAGSPIPVLSYGTSGFYQFKANAVYPNVDSDIVGNAVVVWDDGGNIEAMTVDFPSQTPSGLIAWVNFVGPCTLNRGRQPDVAIRYEQSDSWVDFAFVDLGTTAGNIVVVFEKFTNVQVGVVTCTTHTVQHAGGIIPTGVRKPRIDMPTYWNSSPSNFKNVFACSVFYELIDGGSSYIGSSQLQDVAGPPFPVLIPPPTNVVFEQTYSPPTSLNYGWISDVMNAGVGTIVTPAPSPFDIQLSPPANDLDNFQNSGPVTTFAGDLITYVAWDWNNTGFPGRPNNTPEVLSRRLMLDLDLNTTLLTGTLYNHAIPAPTTTRYFVVGEGYNIPEPQTVVSIDGTNEWVYYLFTSPLNGRLYYKRSLQSGTIAVRQSKPQTIEAQGGRISEIAIYPNPAKEYLYLNTGEGINLITLIGADGKMVKKIKCDVSSIEHEIPLGVVEPGVYTLLITQLTGETMFKKLVVVK